MAKKDLFEAIGVSTSKQGFEQQRVDAARYRFLRDASVEAIREGGIFVGVTPANIVVNGEDLDTHVDAAMRGQLV